MTTIEDTMVEEVLKEQEEGPDAAPAGPKKKSAKAKPIAAKGGAFLDRNETKATKPVRMKELEKEEKQKEKLEAVARRKRIKEDAAKVKRDLAEQQERYRKEKEAMATRKTGKPKSKRNGNGNGKAKNGNGNGKRTVGKRIGDDDALVSTMVKYLKKDNEATWSGVLKAMRADGHAAGQSRARRLFSKAQKTAGVKAAR